MKTFFYSFKNLDCGTDCHWQICSQRFLAKLKRVNGLQDIRPIFGEVSYVSPPLDTVPRNGDIVILYAENSRQLDSIIAVREGFDGMKKILVVADSAGSDGHKYHMLAPRFITQAERNIGELEAVVLKMKGHAH